MEKCTTLQQGCSKKEHGGTCLQKHMVKKQFCVCKIMAWKTVKNVKHVYTMRHAAQDTFKKENYAPMLFS